MVFDNNRMKIKNTNTMQQNKNASIIGYWRNGMTFDEIAVVMDMSTFDVERIVFNYSKGIK